MNETVRIWLNKLYEDAIKEAKETIKNEHILELGYKGNDNNPHTENIKSLNEYIKVLEELNKEIEIKYIFDNIQNILEKGTEINLKWQNS